MESVFGVLAEENRRDILRLLLQSERSVGELEQELNRSQPSISKHLRVLREAGFVESRVEAQKRMYRIRSEPFVHGVYRRREMSISVPGKGLQNTRQIETILKVKVDESDFTWQMTATGLLGGFRQRDSGSKERWVSGDSSFDTVVDVRTNDEGRFARVFHVDRRAVIAQILKGSKATITLRGGVLSFAEFGLIADDLKRERIMEITDVLCNWAEVVEGR